MHCILTTTKEYQSLKQETGINDRELKARIAVWQEDNGLDKWPTASDLGLSGDIKPGVEELFESNPELANAVHDALGFKSQLNSRLTISQEGSDGFGYVLGLYNNNQERVGKIVFRQKTYLKHKGFPIVNELHLGFEEEYQGKGYFQDALIELLKYDDSPIFISTGRVVNTNVFKAISNVDSSKLIVAKIDDGHIIYLNNQITPQQKQQAQQYQLSATSSTPDESLDKKLKDILAKMGVSYKAVESIEGGAVAKADILQAVLEVVEGKRDVTTLSEEAAHFFVDMLPNDSPLLKALLKGVEKTTMYKKVVEEYNGVYKGNKEKLAKEAIGKLIAQEIVGLYQQTFESDENKSWFSRMFKALLNFLRGRLGKLNFSNTVFNASNPYKQAARQILREDFGGLKKIEEVQQELKEESISSRYFYQVRAETTRAADDLHDDLIATKKMIATNKTGTGYVKLSTGQDVKNRVTNLVKAYYKRLGRVLKPSLVTEASKVQGLYLHKMEELILNDVIAGNPVKSFTEYKTESKNNLISEREEVAKAYSEHGELVFKLGLTSLAEEISFRQLVEKAKAIHSNIQANQAKINAILKTQDKARILTEVIVYDENIDTAGTIDVMVIYSNGAVGLYDYKTSASEDPLQNEEAYTIQMDKYKQILHDVYKVNFFAETRIAPFNVKRNPDNPYQVLSIEGTPGKYGTAAYKESLEFIPIKEFTFDEKENDILKELYKQKERYKNALSKDKKSKELKTKAYKLDSIIKAIVLRHEYNTITEEVNRIIEEFTTREILADEGSLKDTELSTMREALTVYNNILGNFKIDPEDKQSIQYAVARSMIDDTITKIDNKIKEGIITTTGFDVTVNSAELGGLTRLFGQLSEIPSNAFKALHELVNKASYATLTEVTEVINRVKEAKKELDKWASANGLSTLEAYRKLIKVDKNGKRLIPQFSKKFYEDKASAKEVNGGKVNIAWFLENANIEKTPEGFKYKGDKQKEYIEARAAAVKEINEYHSTKTGEHKKNAIQAAIAKWDSRYNPNHASALANDTNWFVQYNPSKEEYFSEEYRYVLANKPLLAFYNMLVEYNTKFRKMTGNNDIHSNFISKVKNDLISQVAQNGIMSIGGLKESFLSSLEIRQQDILKGATDANGAPVLSIPLLYTDDIFYPTEKELEELKEKYPKEEEYLEALEKLKIAKLSTQSDDLANSLILFAQSAYNYKHMKDIELMASNIRTIISGKDYTQLVTDAAGNTIVDDITKQAMEKYGIDPKDLDLYDKFVRYYIYGQKMQSKDRTFNLFGKTTSVNKTIMGLQSYVAMNALGLNVISGVGNAVGMFSNVMMKMSEGRVFDKGNIKTAFEFLAKNGLYKEGSIINQIVDIVQPYQKGLDDKTINKLKSTRIEKVFNARNMMIFLQNPDEVVDLLTMVSMMDNYGVDDKGIPRRIEILRSKDKEVKTLLQMYQESVKDDKVTLKLDEHTIRMFRNMVLRTATSIKGAVPQDDKYMATTDITWNMIMFFRNWIPGLAKERFKGFQYDEVMHDFTIGRFTAVQNLLFGNGSGVRGFLETGMNLLLETSIVGKYAGGLKKINPKYLEAKFQMYLESNPELKEKFLNGEFTKEDYISLQMSKLKAFVMEFRILCILVGIVSLLKATLPPDDDDSNIVVKNLYLMAKRGSLESTFWFSPMSVNQILTRPLSLMSVGNSIYNIIANDVIDSSRDAVFGQNSSQDKTGPFYYSIQAVPIAGNIIANNLDLLGKFKK